MGTESGHQVICNYSVINYSIGGNGTLMGASANVVAAGLAGRAGHPITFGYFTKIGAPTVVVCIVMCVVYLNVVYVWWGL